MLTLYRWLLYLYPPVYRREYRDEMVSVFRDAHTDASAGTLRDRISFRVREASGLLAGAVREHVRIINGSDQLISFRRFTMRPEFRFPRSTVALMLIIFAGVILAMEKANTVQVAYAAGADSIWPSTPWFFGLVLLLACASAVAVWGLLFALKRTGADRLADIQPGPNRAD